MSSGKSISPTIRIVSGVIGMLGFAGIAFTAAQNGGFQPDLLFLASVFAGYIFLYVALFWAYPWDRKSGGDIDH